MNWLAALLGLLVAYWVVLALRAFWRAAPEAYRRWRAGKALFETWGERDAALQEEAAARRARSESELWLAYTSDNYKILDPAFRRQFRDRGLHLKAYAAAHAASDGRCAACRKKFALNPRRGTIHVDHIKPQSLYPHLVYVVSNLQVLCRPCNTHKSAYDGEDWRDVVKARRQAATARQRAARAKRGVSS